MSYEAWNYLIEMNLYNAITSVFSSLGILDFFMVSVGLVIIIGLYNTTKSWEATGFGVLILGIIGFFSHLPAIGETGGISVLAFYGLIAALGGALAFIKIVRKN